MIPVNGENRNITTEHGAIEESHVIAAAKAIQANDDKKRQASSLLFALLDNILGVQTIDEVKQKSVNVEVLVSNNPVKQDHGTLCLFQMIMLVTVDTGATIATILKQLTSHGLSGIMEEVKSDIKAFNTKVNMKMVALRARKKEVPDIVPALFEAYKSAGDSSFVAYIERKEQDYEDNTLSTCNNQCLLKLALDKYKALNEKKVWGKKSDHELDFIAMKAELALTKKVLQLLRKQYKTPANRFDDERGGKAPVI